MIISRIGATVKLNNQAVVITKATEGCVGCVFKTDEGAISCAYAVICFAHCRRDRKSVIFAATR